MKDEERGKEGTADFHARGCTSHRTLKNADATTALQRSGRGFDTTRHKTAGHSTAAWESAVPSFPSAPSPFAPSPPSFILSSFILHPFSVPRPLYRSAPDCILE